MAVTDRRYGVAEGQAVKSPCVAATTANITLAGEQTIDGIACVEGDRVLVKDQSTASQNGIYVVSTGNWTRAKDFDGSLDVVKGSRVWVNGGSMNGSQEFFVTTSDPITIDSSSIAFSSLEVLLNAAPGNADYLVKTANGTLTAERVVTDTTSVVWDFMTPAQAKATVPAATTSLSGISELATSAEAITGTDTTRTVTPAALAATIAAVSPALPRGYIDGCIVSNNGSDATNDIDISAGVCRDSANAANINCAAMTKRLDANWAPGTNQGGRDSSGVIGNNIYHVYAVSKADGTQDYYETTAATAALALTALGAESGGTGYVNARLIMSIIRVSAAIKAFKQYADGLVIWSAPVFETVGTAFDTTQRNYVLTVPTGINGLMVDCTIDGKTSAGQGTLVTGHPDQTLATPTNSATPANPFDTANLTNVNHEHSYARLWRAVNASAQIAVKMGAASSASYISTFGFRHPRGKDA